MMFRKKKKCINYEIINEEGELLDNDFESIHHQFMIIPKYQIEKNC